MDSRPVAVLALEDGSVFRGQGFGARTRVTGEVVFNTSMVGYPESLTDPSYYGQIVVMTFPILGSYGLPSYSLRDEHGLPLHYESDAAKVTGYGVHSLSKPSHWSSEKALGEWLAEEGVPGICGIDTRALTQTIRMKGTMLGILEVSQNDVDRDTASIRTDGLKDPNADDLVKKVTTSEPVHYVNNADETIVLVDCGVKYGILRNLLEKGPNVVRVPYDYSIDDILEFEPSGIVISNGPGDPRRCEKTINTTRQLLETDIPIMGICLGAQLIALAAGGETYKLKFGHRAVNHPCIDSKTGRCYITTQNHGYSIKESSLKDTDFDVRFVNANDKTVEGIVHRTKKIIGVQWHPESSPGPFDTRFLFDEFVEDVSKT